MIISNFRIAVFQAYKQIMRSNKRSLFLTMLVMTLSYINLLLVTSLLLGIIVTMDEQFVNTVFAHIVIEPDDDERYIKDVGSKKDLINSLPWVEGLSAHYMTVADISYDKDNDNKEIKRGTWLIVSMVPEDEARITTIDDSIVAGRFLEKTDRDKVIIGREVSGGYDCNFEQRSLQGADVGEKIKITYANGISREYEIAGIFVTKSFAADDRIYITEKEMESVFHQGNNASQIIVRAKSEGNEVEQIQELRTMGLVKDKIKPWVDFTGMTRGITKSFSIIRMITYFIGLSVAGVTIFIVIYINLINKKKQIGILKAIGMRGSIIITSYTLQALFFAVFGIGSGYLIMKLGIVPYFEAYPFDFPVGPISLEMQSMDLQFSGASLLLVSFFSGIIPSRQIVNKNIIEAIWGRD